MIKKLLLAFSFLNNIDQNKAYFTVFSTSPLVAYIYIQRTLGFSNHSHVPGCAVSHCKPLYVYLVTYRLTASYKGIQKPIQKSYTSPWQAKPHLVNTHDSTLHLHRISSLDAISRSRDS